VVKHLNWVTVILLLVVFGNPARAAFELFPNKQAKDKVEISTVTEPVAVQPAAVQPAEAVQPEAVQPAEVQPTIVQTKSQRKYTNAKRTPKHPEGYRRLAFYAESAISRGDIRFDYEVPLSDAWLGVIQAHLNPNSARNNETGSFGILGGARLYLDGKYQGTFVQGLVGFNNNSSFAVAMELAAGYTILWKENLAFDIGVAMFRSGDGANPDAVFTVMANLVVELDQPLFSFL